MVWNYISLCTHSIAPHVYSLCWSRTITNIAYPFLAIIITVYKWWDNWVDYRYLDSEMFLPVVSEALIELSVLLSGDIVWVTCPQWFSFIQLLVLCVFLFDSFLLLLVTLALLIFILINILYLWLVLQCYQNVIMIVKIHCHHLSISRTDGLQNSQSAVLFFINSYLF